MANVTAGLGRLTATVRLATSRDVGCELVGLPSVAFVRSDGRQMDVQIDGPAQPTGVLIAARTAPASEDVDGQAEFKVQVSACYSSDDVAELVVTLADDIAGTLVVPGVNAFGDGLDDCFGEAYVGEYLDS